MMKKLIGFCAAIFLCITTATAQTLYQVELIAFARNSSDAENEENWDRALKLRYPERYIALQPGDGTDASFQQLPADTLQLQREANAIARRGWRVLLHTAWRQTVDEPARATAVIINGGKQFGIHHELEGSFTLSIERFLRADANLWLSRFSTQQTAVAAATTLPNPPNAMDAAAGENVHFVPTQIVALQEQRRLRSGELHYFDHPRMGLVVLVTPVTRQE